LPDHKIAYEVISRAQVPIVCPSANLAGRPSPTNFEEAISDLEGLVDLGIDAGATRLGIESTVVDLTTQPLRILREAAIKAKDIEEVAIRKTVLFVCTGNSCRSVIAEALLKKIFWERHRHDVEVLSAGITMLSGMAASDQAQEVLRKEGIDVSGHVSRQVTRSMIDKSDIILVMEKIHEAKVLSLAPEAKHRLFLLKEFARIQDNALDIEDPMGRDDAFYAQTFATIKEAVERVAEIL
jgi:protein-tyrosine-phosphatase